MVSIIVAVIVNICPQSNENQINILGRGSTYMVATPTLKSQQDIEKSNDLGCCCFFINFEIDHVWCVTVEDLLAALILFMETAASLYK